MVELVEVPLSACSYHNGSESRPNPIPLIDMHAYSFYPDGRLHIMNEADDAATIRETWMFLRVVAHLSLWRSLSTQACYFICSLQVNQPSSKLLLLCSRVFIAEAAVKNPRNWVPLVQFCATSQF